MASDVKRRIKIPKTASLDEVITVKTLITHRMESGHRIDGQGETVPRSILNRFVAQFEDHTVIDVQMEPSISSNPYFKFEVRIPHSGTFRFAWYDDDGQVYTETATIDVV